MPLPLFKLRRDYQIAGNGCNYLEWASLAKKIAIVATQKQASSFGAKINKQQFNKKLF